MTNTDDVSVVVERCCLYFYTSKTVNFGSVNIKKRHQEKALEFMQIVSFFLWKVYV